LKDPERYDGDELVSIIAERQYRDWRDFRNRPFDDPEARDVLQFWADELVQERGWRKTLISGSRAREAFVEEPPVYGPGGSERPTKFDPPNSTNQQIGPERPLSLRHIASGTNFRDKDKDWCPEMVVIPPGSFVMGSSPDEEGHHESEEPEHFNCHTSTHRL